VVVEGEVCGEEGEGPEVCGRSRVQLDGKGAGARGVLLLWASRLGDGPETSGFTVVFDDSGSGGVE